MKSGQHGGSSGVYKGLEACKRTRCLRIWKRKGEDQSLWPGVDHAGGAYSEFEEQTACNTRPSSAAHDDLSRACIFTCPTMSFIGLPRVKSPATVFPPPPTPATPTSPPEMNGGTPTPRDIEKHLSSLRPSVAPTAVATPDDTGQPGAGTPTSADEKAEEGAGGRRKRKRKRRARERAEELLETLRPTLMLVNSGSVARDHLASERTFLAYVRTSIGLSTMGVGEFPLS